MLGLCDGLKQLTRLFVFDVRRRCLHEQLRIPLKSVAQRREFAVTEHRSAFFPPPLGQTLTAALVLPGKRVHCLMTSIKSDS